MFAEGCDYLLAEGDPVGGVTQTAACYGRDGLGIKEYLDAAKGAFRVFAHGWHWRVLLVGRGEWEETGQLTVNFFVEAEDHGCGEKILILRFAGVI